MRQNEPQRANLIRLFIYLGVKSIAMQFLAFAGLQNVREGSRYGLSLPDLCLSAEFHQLSLFGHSNTSPLGFFHVPRLYNF